MRALGSGNVRKKDLPFAQGYSFWPGSFRLMALLLVFLPLNQIFSQGSARAATAITDPVAGSAKVERIAVNRLWNSTVVQAPERRAEAKVRGSIMPRTGTAGKKSKQHPVLARKIELRGGKRGTVFSLFLSRKVPFQVFTLSDPYRVVIDLPQIDFRLRGKARGRGLVKTYRYGLFAAGRSRIVLDASGPVIVRKAGIGAVLRRNRKRGRMVLRLELAPTDHIGFLLKNNA